MDHVSERLYINVYIYKHSHLSLTLVYLKGDIVYFSENAHNCTCQNICVTHICTETSKSLRHWTSVKHWKCKLKKKVRFLKKRKTLIYNIRGLQLMEITKQLNKWVTLIMWLRVRQSASIKLKIPFWIMLNHAGEHDHQLVHMPSSCILFNTKIFWHLCYLLNFLLIVLLIQVKKKKKIFTSGLRPLNLTVFAHIERWSLVLYSFTYTLTAEHCHLV